MWSTGDSTEDVVAVHRQCNRPPRLPDNARLSVIRDQQSLTTSSHQPSQRPAIVDQPSDVIPPINPVTEGSEPHQLQFYEPAVRDILE
jgi:hypothetical protein